MMIQRLVTELKQRLVTVVKQRLVTVVKQRLVTVVKQRLVTGVKQKLVTVFCINLATCFLHKSSDMCFTRFLPFTRCRLLAAVPDAVAGCWLPAARLADREKHFSVPNQNGKFRIRGRAGPGTW